MYIWGGHIVHTLWYSYCMAAILLALNRYVEIKSSQMARRLFSNESMHLWLVLILVYGVFMGMGAWDLPPIYNSVYSVFLFQIDLREGAPPTLNRFCFFNSCWVTSSLVLIYTLLGLELHRRTRFAAAAAAADPTGAAATVKSLSRKQKNVLLQCFLVCFFVFGVASTWIVFELWQPPLWLSRICIVTVQIGSGFTSIVYITFNDTIRAGVWQLVFGRWCGRSGDGKRGSRVAASTGDVGDGGFTTVIADHKGTGKEK